MHEVVISTSADAGVGGEELGGPAREGAPGRQVAAADDLLDVVELAPLHRRDVERDVRQLCGGTVLELLCLCHGGHLPLVVRLVAGHHGSGLPSWSASRALLSSKYPSSVLVTPASSTGATPGARVDRLVVGDRRTTRVDARGPPPARSAPRGRPAAPRVNSTCVVEGNVVAPGLELLGVAAARAGRRRATRTSAAGPTAGRRRQVGEQGRPRGRGSRTRWRC